MRQHISGKLLASGAVVMAAVCLGGCFFGNSKGKNYQEHVDNIDEHVDELTGGEKVKLVTVIYMNVRTVMSLLL